MDALERFVYLGTLLPYYVHRREPVKTANYSQINTLITQIDGDAYIKIVEKYTGDQCLPRKDELWFTFAAYLLNSTVAQNDRKKVKLSFPKYAKTSEDLFLFAKYAKDLLKEEKRNHFSTPIRDTICSWYKAQDTAKLIDMICINRGLYKFQHKDLIKICHINLKSIGKGEVEKYIFKRCNQFVKENETNNKIPNSMKKLNDVSKLKTTTDPNIVKQLIKENKMKYEYVPKYYLKRVDIFEALLPTLSYRVLLDSIHMIVETKMVNNSSFHKAYFTALNNRELIRQEKLHPIYFLATCNKQLKDVRYSEKIKQSYYTKKIQKLNVKSNPTVNKKLTKLFETSFDNLQPLGLRIFITINLQENYKRQVVCNQKQTTCFEAAVTLAFSYFKSEKKTAVFTYCPDSSKLEPIPWTKDCNYKKATEICAGLTNKKNAQKTYLPITEAMKKGEQYDLFLVIVPSAARGNPGSKNVKVVEALEMYKKDKNKKARIIFVNLRRFKPAMIHEPSKIDDILEICGLDENTPKIINAFAARQFS